jgi:transcriptional regulator with XRE-family HTH domain
MSHALHNYLRTYRKRAGLSQEEVAFLLGCEDRATVSRYERQVRQPSLTALCAYELILGVPTQELFRGTYEKVGQQVARRAKSLARRHLSPATPALVHRRKLDLLRRIASGSATRSVGSK